MEKDSEWAKDVVSRLHASLGSDASHLIKVIPKLGNILIPSNYSGVSSQDQGSLHALQRLCYLMCQFVEVITDHSRVAITLMLDDLQWADPASFLVLNQLLMRGLNNFFFLCCCRDEVHEGHPFCKTMNNVTSFGIKSVTVKLDCMSRVTLNGTVSDLLCLPPRLVRSLSDLIYSKTKGNPLFFSQLMLSLNRDGLLRLSLPQQRWIWDEDEIRSTKLPDDVARCFANGINNLPFQVQAAIRSLSMFGNSAKFSYLVALESQLNIKLIDPLKIAAAEGLVAHHKGAFSFAHDMIREAAYGMIEETVRCRDHSMYGLCLLKLSFETNGSDALFTAANQVNLGGRDAVLNLGELVTMVKINLRAGKRAVDMADYTLAAQYFTQGISFLPDNHWIHHYSLSLELFELASTAALVTRNIQSLQYISGEVARNARSFEDKLNTYYIVTMSLAFASKVKESFENACAILSDLGIHFPRSMSHESLVQQIQHAQSLIRGLTENDILTYREMTDRKFLMAMKVCFLRPMNFLIPKILDFVN